MDATSITERIHNIATRVVANRGLELVHTEVGGAGHTAVVRVFIDKPEGVTHEDCSEISLDLGTILDVEDFIHSAYTLEVSSPGLERGLYRGEDYVRFSGRPARIKTRAAINGQRNFRGHIVGIEDETVDFADRTNGRVQLPLGNIIKANLEIDLQEELHSKLPHPGLGSDGGRQKKNEARNNAARQSRSE